MLSSTSKYRTDFITFSESEIVTLLVGKAEFPLRVHEDLLLSSGLNFFEACLTNFIESETKQIRLPDDDIIPVRVLVEWLYRGAFGSFQLFKAITTLYKFADKILSENYANSLMDGIREAFGVDQHSMHPIVLVETNKAGLQDTPFYQFCIKPLVENMIKRPEVWQQENFQAHLAGAYKDSQTMQDVVQEILRYKIKSYTNPASWKGCHFHRHQDGSECKAKKT